MLVKLTLPTDTGITKAITAHIYVSGDIPDARYDTATISWEDAEELAEHEMWATRQALLLRVDMIGQCIGLS